MSFLSYKVSYYLKVYVLRYFVKLEDKADCIDIINLLKSSSVEFEFLRDILAACFMLVTYLAYTLTMKMEGVCSSETPMNVCQATGHHILEERTLQSH
jgi:hypothetical protein